MDLLKEVEKILKQIEKYLDTDKRLIRGKIQQDALNLDPSLIRILASNEITKKAFFIKIDEFHVFDKVQFSWILSNKAFLPDSFTKFKNKIGLIDFKEEFISNKNEIVLSFPYKDCYLEGGQISENEKRDEIFMNDILMSDEIDVVLSPKILTNNKEFFSKESSIYEKNIMIKGNNLIATSSLLKTHANSVKLVYLDPPYNTEGAANTFSYNNSFNHSTWLVFMKNRLEVAFKLLTEDGIIAISIDDFEYAHLKVLCDEIFGRESYVGTIVVQSNPRGRTINSNFATSHEYCLFYAKNPQKITIYDLELTNEQERLFANQDSEGNYRYLPFRRSGGTSTPSERPNSEFPLYYSKKLGNIIAVGGKRKHDVDKIYEPETILILDEQNNVAEINPDSFNNNRDIVAIMPIDINDKRRVWRWSDRRKILLAAKNDDFKIQKDQRGYYVQLKDRRKDGRKPKTIWTDSRYDASANGTILLKKMFDGEKLFSYPKSLFTMLDILKIITTDEDIILDFFGGSGSTAHAVLEINKIDGGNRKFIIIEQMDYFNTVTVPRVMKVYDELIESKYEVNPLLVFELKKLNKNLIDMVFKAKESDFTDIYNKIAK